MEKINIRPKNTGYLFICTIIWIFILVLIYLSFIVFIVEKQYIIFFIVALPFDILMCYFFTKIMIYKISFIERKLIVPRVYQIQEQRIEIECNRILNCKIGFEKLYFYFEFRCIDGKILRMFISRFSLKQLCLILQMIKDRGGLQEQSIEDVLGVLSHKKKKKVK